mmetsp:Transcript_31360/g.61927  ORF Transcript_31360/g.61927 Transcript_31360/m.61927 type:complete len:94 (-) Transcript_31360:1220-1501(-)
MAWGGPAHVLLSYWVCILFSVHKTNAVLSGSESLFRRPLNPPSRMNEEKLADAQRLDLPGCQAETKGKRKGRPDERADAKRTGDKRERGQIDL